MKLDPTAGMEPNKLGIPDAKRVPNGVLKNPAHAHDIRQAKKANDAETQKHLARKHGDNL